jgi:hypothetical protein
LKTYHKFQEFQFWQLNPCFTGMRSDGQGINCGFCGPDFADLKFSISLRITSHTTKNQCPAMNVFLNLYNTIHSHIKFFFIKSLWIRLSRLYCGHSSRGDFLEIQTLRNDFLGAILDHFSTIFLHKTYIYQCIVI